LRHPRLTLAGIAGLCALAAAALFGASGIRIALDPSSEPLIRADDPGRALYRQAVLDFGDDEIYVIAMETRDVFRSDHLEALRRLTRELAALPGVRRVESLVSVNTVRNDPATGLLEVGPLVREIPREPDELARLRARALADPLLVRSLISPDGRTAAMNLRFEPRTHQEQIAAGTDGAIRQLVAAEATAERRFYVAGRPYMKATAHAMMVSDLLRLMPLALLVMAAVLALVSGTLIGVLIPIGTVAVATLWTFGLMAACGLSLNLLTVVLGPVLIAVGGVYGVHVLAHYEAAAASADTRAEAARLLADSTRRPVWIAGSSTVAGFGSLLLTDAPAARELGLFAAIGVASVTLLSRCAIPAAVALLPLRPRTESGRAARIGQRLDGQLRRLSDLACQRRKAVIGVWLLLSGLAALLLPRIEVDTDYLSFFAPSSRLRQDFAAINERLSGAIPIYVVLSSSAPGGFNRPEDLEVVEALERRFGSLSGVTHATSVAALVRAANQAIHEDDPHYARLPAAENGIAELLLVIPKAMRRPLVNVDQSRTNVPVRSGKQGSAAVRELVAEIEAAIGELVPAGLEAHITGDTVLLNRSADRLARSQLTTVGTTTLVVFAIVATLFRSLPLALVALLPNLLPVLLFYGLLGAGIAPLSLPTSLIGSIVLGIAVDDTAHFLTRYRRSRDAGASPEEAVRECGRRVGRPIVITSVMLFLGFLVVTLSGFTTLQEFGWLVGLTLAICLATDLLLLPAVLVSARIR